MGAKIETSTQIEKETEPKEYAFKEAAKEVLRYMISIGLIDSAIVLFQLVQSMIDVTTGSININWAMIGAFTLFSLSGAAVRALDKFKHEYSKLVNPDTVGESQGIIPF